MVAVTFTFMFKQDTDVREYEALFGEVTKPEHNSDNEGMTVILVIILTY